MKRMNIRYALTAPLSHIGETASTGSYFNMVQTADGRLPVVTGNSIRGQLRDSMAKHLLDRLDTAVDKEVFNVLFSGGNVSNTMKNDVARARQVREHFPMVSLLGGGLGTMIMSGKILVGFAYPICREAETITGINSDATWRDFLGSIEFTRMDDSKDDKLFRFLADPDEEKTGKASTQMRYEVEYLAAGTELSQTILFLDDVADLEMGAFYAGLREWFKVPRLGGMANKGFGFFDAVTDGISVENGETRISDSTAELIAEYEAFIDAEGTQYLGLLKEGKKNGKKADKAAEGDSTSD